MTKMIRITTLSLVICLCFNFGCKERERVDFELKSFDPKSFEFEKDSATNRIDYYFVEGKFTWEEEEIVRLNNMIISKMKSEGKNKYLLHSIYIYQNTDIINSVYSGGKAGLDGHNMDLISYIRYKNTQPDIFYIIKNGIVIYDLMSKQKTDFEFDE